MRYAPPHTHPIPYLHSQPFTMGHPFLELKHLMFKGFRTPRRTQYTSEKIPVKIKRLSEKLNFLQPPQSIIKNEYRRVTN